MRNHYIPQFYLKKWYCDKEQKILVYTRDPKKNLRIDFRSSKSIGYKNDLYSIEQDGLLALNDKDESLEESFFQEIDDSAAKVHEKITSNGINSLDDRDRNAWSKFIEALLERSPKRINGVISKVSSEARIKIDQEVENLQSEEMKRTAREILSRADFDRAVRNATLDAMRRSIEEGELAKGIVNYQWITIDHKNNSEHFLTSDNPLLINNGIETNPAWCISIALSPSRLLVMMADRPEFDDDFIIRLAATHSIQMCRQADKYLISSKHLEKAKFTNYKSAASDLFQIEKP